MNVVPPIFLCCGLAGLLGCVSASSGEPAYPRTLAKGGLSGVTEAKQEVIKNEAAWKKFWAQHAAPINPVPKTPAVDFSKEMVIATTLGTKRTGGYSIEITSAEPKDDKLKVTVKKTSPPPGAMTIMALTAPFHFVAVPRSDLKPEFVDAKPVEKK
jgi:hypothetical protein